VKMAMLIMRRNGDDSCNSAMSLGYAEGVRIDEE